MSAMAAPGERVFASIGRRLALSLRILSALCAFFVLAVGVAACGGVPGNAVAKVGDQAITRDQFNHWMGIAAKASQQSAPGQPAPAPPDPPDFPRCIANLKKVTPKPPQGQPAPTDQQFKQQCQQQFDGLKNQVMQFLINALWVQGEAKDQKVTVTDAEVQKQFESAKRQSFPKEAAFQQFLQQRGETVQDVLFQFRLNLLGTRLRQQITKSRSNVTPQQIAAYYNSHKQQFGQPEKRDLLVVLTKTRGKALQAKAALAHGQSWGAVAKKFSTDPQTKNKGGLLKAAIKADQDPGLAPAFAAPKGKLQGPVKGQFGYYVFKIQRITPPSQQPLAKVQAQIRNQLVVQGSQSALTAFQKIFKKKWLDKTDCRKEYAVPDYCKNAPKPKPAPAVPGQPVPGQGGAQPQPGQGGAQPPAQGGAPPSSGGGQGAP